MLGFSCPSLDGDVELPAQREEQILRHHPELSLDLYWLLTETLASPDLVDRRADREDVGLVRYFPEFSGGRFFVAVVRSDRERGSARLRHWLVTCYASRGVETWKSLWERP